MTDVVMEIPCSEDQRLLIEEVIFKGAKLEILPTERILIYEACKIKYPISKIVNAHLDLEEIKWVVKLEVPIETEEKTKAATSARDES